MMKYLFALFVSLVSLSALAYDFESDGLYYNIVSESDKTCEVAGYGDYYIHSSGQVKIPATCEFGEVYTVIGIADHAFEGTGNYTFDDIESYWNIRIRGISFPNTLKYIGKYAFDSCNNLQSITIPDSVVELGEGAFRNCIQAGSIKLGDNIKEIGDKAFQNCLRLNTLQLPANVEIIGERAFAGCKSLDNINLPRGLKEIGQFAFNNCESIEEIFIPNTVTRINSSAFASRNDNFKKIIIEDGDKSLYIAPNTFYGMDLTVYLGRTLTQFGMGNVVNTINVTIGPLVTNVYYFFNDVKFKTSGSITSYCVTPPILGDFDSDFFSRYSISVPQQSVETYKSAQYWKRFSRFSTNTPPAYYSLIGDFNGGQYPGAVFSRVWNNRYSLDLPSLSSGFQVMRNFDSRDILGADNAKLSPGAYFPLKETGNPISLASNINSVQKCTINLNTEDNLLSIFGTELRSDRDYIYLIGHHNDWLLPDKENIAEFDSWKLYLNQDGCYENTFIFPNWLADFYFISQPVAGEYERFGPSKTTSGNTYEVDGFNLSTKPIEIDLSVGSSAIFSLLNYESEQVRLRVDLSWGSMTVSKPSAEFRELENSVEEIIEDSAPAVFYDMTGRRATNLKSGIYIKVTGNKSEKILIR